MSFIVLQPWALYPGQDFFYPLQLLFISLNSLSLPARSLSGGGRLLRPPQSPGIGSNGGEHRTRIQLQDLFSLWSPYCVKVGARLD